MRQCRLVFWFLTCLAGPLLAQNEWVLQKFLEVRGDTPFVELGHVVTGFANSSANNPFNVAVSKLMTIGCYTIDSPDDLLPQRTYWGANLVHGDFNGDGWTDLAVHREYPVLIGPAPDTVLIYLGNSAGIDTIPILKIPEDAGICSNSFGRNMAFGDLNNDEFDDLIICNQTYFKDENHLNEFGKVNIYLGRQQLRNSYDYSIIGITPYNHGLGWDCAIGDVNNDGYGDLSLIGYDTSAPSYDLHLWFSYLEIYLGSANFDIERDFYLKGADIHTQKIACFDANGDGIDDLLWSNQQRIPGRPGPDQSVLIFYGGSDFDLQFDFIIPHPDTTISYVYNFGQSLANAGDMNGDGYADILVGAPYSFYGSGILFVYCGGRALDTFFDAAVGQLVDSRFGWSLDGIGDVNGDGLADIVVGAPDYDWGKGKGYYAIYLGDRRIPNQVRPDPYTHVQTPTIVPNTFVLEQNYPNPFNEHTRIEYDLPIGVQVRLAITDVLGQEVMALVDKWQPAGRHSIAWHGKNRYGKMVPSGSYFYQLEAGTFKQSKTMVLVR